MGGKTAQGIGTALRRFLRRLEGAYPPSVVLLFGSRGRGDALVDSDVDLLVVSESFREMGWRERILVVLELWDGAVPLEPLCYTPEEFERRSQEISIVSVAVREGSLLIEPDERWKRILRQEAFI